MTSEHEGNKMLFVLPAVPEGVDKELRNAIEIRNTATRTGTCPSCGATRKYMGIDHREQHLTMIEHEDPCPAGDDYIGPMVQDHAARGFMFDEFQIITAELPEEHHEQ